MAPPCSQGQGVSELGPEPRAPDPSPAVSHKPTLHSSALTPSCAQAESDSLPLPMSSSYPLAGLAAAWAPLPPRCAFFSHSLVATGPCGSAPCVICQGFGLRFLAGLPALWPAKARAEIPGRAASC